MPAHAPREAPGSSHAHRHRTHAHTPPGEPSRALGSPEVVPSTALHGRYFDMSTYQAAPGPWRLGGPGRPSFPRPPLRSRHPGVRHPSAYYEVLVRDRAYHTHPHCPSLAHTEAHIRECTHALLRWGVMMHKISISAYFCSTRPPPFPLLSRFPVFSLQSLPQTKTEADETPWDT